MRLPPVLRGLLRTPGETALAVLALGVGIALTTSLFSIVKGILWTALPIPDITRVVRIDTASDLLAGFREQDGHKLFESIDGITVTGANARIGNVAHRLQAAYVSPTFFATLRTDAARGTAILQTHPYRTAVISHSLWSTVLNQDRNVLGRPILINNEPVTIVGVMPSRWGYPRAEDVWVAWDHSSANTIVARGRGSSSFLIGRLRPHADLKEVRSAVNVIAARLHQPQPGERPPFLEVTPVAETNVKGEIRYLMFAILVCCFFVLLIACANLANLTLARTARRVHELGIRAALGGTRWRLIWVLLEENLVLSLAGSALGVALASVVLDVFTGLLNQEAQLTGGGVSSLAFTIDAAVLAFVLLLSVSTALASGIVPALRATAGEIEQVLRSGSKALTPRSGRFVGTLIQVQLAASVLLLVGTGAMASLTAQFGAGVTYDPAKILSARIDLGGNSASTLQDLPAALTAHPDIVAAAFTTAEHIERVPSASITPEAGASERNSDGARARLQGVSPGYFDVFGCRLLAGRPFDARDTASAPKAAIVNLAFANRYWRRTDAVGRRFHVDPPQGQPVEWLTVVGVIEDIGSIKDSAHQRTPAFYRPIPQMEIAELSIVARHRTDAGRITQPLIGAMKASGLEYPLFQVYTAEQIMQMESIGTRIPALLLGACGLCGLILSAIGAYGVLSLSVKQRTREIGIRLALGAAPNEILRATLAQGLRHVALGITLGLIGGLVLTRVLASLFGSLTMQVGVSLGVVMIMTVVGITAVAIPARAASRLEPTIALRD